MSASHHPCAAWLLDYSLGNLPELFETVIRAHVGACAACRDDIAFAERLGGDFLGALPATTATLCAADIHTNFEQASGDAEPLSRAHHSIQGDDIEQFVVTYLKSSLDCWAWRPRG